MAKNPRVTTDPIDLPDWTEDRAVLWAKLLFAGCPPMQAVIFFVQGLTIEQQKEALRLWSTHPLTQKAVNDLQGGSWLDLTNEQRVRIAYDKHIAEVAFYVHSHSFVQASDKDDIEKMKQAREVLKAVLGHAPDGDPMADFAKWALGQVMERAKASKTSPALVQGRRLSDGAGGSPSSPAPAEPSIREGAVKVKGPRRAQ